MALNEGEIVSSSTAADVPEWRFARSPWGRYDALALLVWTVAVAAFFWDAVSFRGAFFYFDITEINFPYRSFFASELRAGRFSRWCPGLYCGHPLYSESQTGYLHPLKYLLYPWLDAWKAFNLDTVLSIWLTGLGTYGWLRRHVGPTGALTGAAVFGLSGFVWAHLIHTSMNNALTSVPFVFWALETAWEGGRLRGLTAGAVAIACQVFAGHLQDTILTVGAVGLYGLYRALTEPSRRARFEALGLTFALLALGIALAGVQWVPSKELLDRSPRSKGLKWDELTYGSWNPELLPTLVVREAYGTRARDTDWMDGFYPYHEMNVYMGLVAMGLAVVGAGAYRDRWVGFWVLLTGVGGLLMLGRFTFLLDFAHRIPVLGSSRIPVRFHLWVSLAVAALAAVGVDRLSRPGRVGLRGAIALGGVLVLASIPILYLVYEPVWAEPQRWNKPYHLDRFRWLENELTIAAIRTLILAALGLMLAASAARTARPARRALYASFLPLVVIADLLGSHWYDAPTVAPGYWTEPPASARVLKADPTFVRLFGIAEKSAGEPGYASEPVNFPAVRDTLDWSLPIVWGLATARGETPILPRRSVEFTDQIGPAAGRFDVQSVTHIVTGRPFSPLLGQGQRAGSAYIFRNPRALPRARLMGRPSYAASELAAIQMIAGLGPSIRERVLVEDPDRPLPVDSTAAGTATIGIDLPEHVEVATDSTTDCYLVLADTFDPGWSATLDGRSAPIRPAFVAFRAVFVPKGRHTIAFRYEPAGFRLGLALTVLGALVALGCLAWPRPVAALTATHGDAGWPRHWPRWWLAGLLVIVALSSVKFDHNGRLLVQDRWSHSGHRFTWGAGIEAMNVPRGR